MFHRFSPLAERSGLVVRQKKALKIGQKVMCDDFYPLAEGWKVVANDFWVLAEGSGVIANDFRPIVLKCFLSGRQDDTSLRWRGSSHVENNQALFEVLYVNRQSLRRANLN